MDSDITFVDITVLIVLIGLVFLMAWVIKLTGQIQDSKINSICKKPPSVTIKQGSIINKPASFPIPAVIIPPNDLTIDFNLNC
jgi:hypothetical protein